MKDHNLEEFEAELHALKPAPVPPELLARLQGVRPSSQTAVTRSSTRAPRQVPPWWHWLAPATVAAGIALAFGPLQRQHGGSLPAQPAAGVSEGIPTTDDAVEIERELVGSYDAVAELSSGLPVRFHCQEWEDKLLFRDPRRGIAIERRTPRVEVVRISFDTY
jgi:hypothetical protein